MAVCIAVLFFRYDLLGVFKVHLTLITTLVWPIQSAFNEQFIIMYRQHNKKPWRLADDVKL